MSEINGAVGVRKLAKILKVTPAAVSKASKTGRIKPHCFNDKGHPLYLPEETLKNWKKNTTLSMDSPVLTKEEKPKKVNTSKQSEEVSQIFITNEELTENYRDAFSKAKASKEYELYKKEYALRERAEIELAKLQGEILDAEETKKKLIQAFTEFRNRLLGVPAMIKNRCPSTTIEQIGVFDEEIRKALTELSERLINEHTK